MTSPDHTPDRAALRRRLLTARQQWHDTPEGHQAQAQLSTRLWEVLQQLEPDTLGIYWPMKGEFNPSPAALRAQTQWDTQLALPFAQREPVAMHFRVWDGQSPTERDGCGVPSSEGKPIQPDVVLVPCVGFTRDGYRLGYGGGYFDRYVSAHPDATVIGVAWDQDLLDEGSFQAEPHDQAMMAVVTPSRIWTPD